MKILCGNQGGLRYIVVINVEYFKLKPITVPVSCKP
jgi:hypothetical protein